MLDRCDEVGATADAAVGDHRHRRRRCHRADQIEVDALAGALVIDVRHQDLSDPDVGGQCDPLVDREGRGIRSSAGVDDVAVLSAAHVETRDDRLRSEGADHLADGVGVRDQRRVDDDLLEARGDDRLRLRGGLDAAAVGEWDERLGGDPVQQLHPRRDAALRRTDVEDHQFIDLEVVEDADDVDRVADVAGIFEALGLHEAVALEEQDGDQPGIDVHQASATANSPRSASPKRWLFSGWNWIPITLSRSTDDA